MATTINDSGLIFPDNSWQSSARGKRQYISSLTASNSASLNFTDFSDTYNHYDVVLNNIMVTSGYYTCLRYYIGSVYQSSGYVNAGLYWHNVLNGATIGGQTSYGIIDPYTYNATNSGISGTIQFTNCRTTNTYKHSFVHVTGFYFTSGYNVTLILGNSWLTNQSALDGFQLVPTGGSIISGSLDIYGWN